MTNVPREAFPTADEIQNALSEIVSCLEDTEDGHGYLWDAMKGLHGKVVLHVLDESLRTALYSERPSEPFDVDLTVTNSMGDVE
jgi:hypothetical protein